MRRLERDQQQTAVAQKAQRELGWWQAKKNPRLRSRQRSRARTSTTMTTQEQVQEVLERLHAQEARSAALETQLQSCRMNGPGRRQQNKKEAR